MDKQRYAEQAKQWKATPQGRAGKPLPERLMTNEELPEVYAREHFVKTKDDIQAEEDEFMKKPRVRQPVHYTDGRFPSWFWFVEGYD